jgi:hypothetical protein
MNASNLQTNDRLANMACIEDELVLKGVLFTE